MWTFILVGTFAAVGAALAVGTLAALVRYHRTGSFPEREDGSVAEPTTGRLVGLWLRVLVGATVAGWGVVTLMRRGLLL